MKRDRLKLPDPRYFKDGWGDVELDLLARLVYHPIYGLVYRHRYNMAIPSVPVSGKLLEIGCGYGLFLPALSQKAKELYATDIHERLGKVKSVMESEGLPRLGLSRADMLQLPYKDGSFDTVVCMSVLEHVTELSQATAEIARIIKKGGSLIAGFPVKNVATGMLFRLVDRDDDEIHPNGHRQILRELDKRFSRRVTKVFPPYLPVDLGFYCIGEYRKDD